MKSLNYLSGIERISLLHGSSYCFDDFIHESMRILLSSGDLAKGGAIFTVDEHDRELLHLRSTSFLPTILQNEGKKLRLGSCLCSKAILLL